MQIRTWLTVIVVLCGSSSVAQSNVCNGIDPNSEGSITLMATCLSSLQSEIGNLRAQREAMRTEITQLGGEIANINRIFGQAVVAFNRSERAGGACPLGWSLFKPAGGRVMVGAGQHDNADLSEYPAFSDDPSEAIGGKEAVILERNQVPDHTHTVDLALSNMSYRDPSVPNQAGPYPEDNLRIHTGKPLNYSWIAHDQDWVDATVGGGEAHTNMPPFIALYFCTKD